MPGPRPLAYLRDTASRTFGAPLPGRRRVRRTTRGSGAAAVSR